MRRCLLNPRHDLILDDGVVFDGRVRDHDDEGIGSDDIGIKENLISIPVILYSDPPQDDFYFFTVQNIYAWLIKIIIKIIMPLKIID